jgi:hypothetical protein
LERPGSQFDLRRIQEKARTKGDTDPGSKTDRGGKEDEYTLRVYGNGRINK